MKVTVNDLLEMFVDRDLSKEIGSPLSCLMQTGIHLVTSTQWGTHHAIERPTT